MRKIKNKKTKPEIALRKALRKEKLRFRSYNKKLCGNPDIVLLDKKVVIFVDGEFWHGYRWNERLNIKMGRSHGNKCYP